ncbi:Molybdenum cofactor guanylyltransferase [Ascidiaceihabitans donghaensis]|uniref:Molybdenum cofactor guanylyltransferase n=1 Tax=Ascidiaceihabitans donghaensis TaxID=1510460 RepID=A0A2R8BAG1_9RHOB|nr:molybdenum cofactor guanylyltransferase MobA [Ascidiaceihabitans donghaensis]SPH20065.1 Molybdenum cofactor guanylyltransferase [Ascidiaceihabitans donghaensis]
MTLMIGIILAGGQATRMGGGDKGVLPLGDQTLLQHVIERLASQVDSIALNANGDPSRFSAYNLPVIADSMTGFAGPLAGVLAGMDYAASQGADTIVTAAADTPFFPSDLVECLQAAAQSMVHPLALAATPHPDRNKLRHPTFGLWPVALRDDLRTALHAGTRKVVQWTDGHHGRLAMFPSEDAFFNVNTPDDLVKAQAML